MTIKNLSFPNYIYNMNDAVNTLTVTYSGQTYTRSILPGSYTSFDQLSEKINEALKIEGKILFWGRFWHIHIIR